MQSNCLCLANIPFFVGNKLCNRCLVYSWILSKDSNGLFLSIVGFQNSRPLWPRIISSSFSRRLRHHFQLCNRFGSQTDHCSHTVVSGIASAYHKNMPVSGHLIWYLCKITVQKSSGYCSQEIYGKPYSLCVSSRHSDISGRRSSAGQKYSVIRFQKLLCFDIFSHVCLYFKDYTFFFHQTDSAVYYRFFQLHIWNSIPQQTSGTIASFINNHRMSSPVQLLRRCKTGWSASYDCNCVSGTNLWFLRLHPAFCKCGFNNGSFVFFGCHRLSVQIAGTGSLTESRTHSGRKFRKAVCLGQP